jgi:hypothetical protein
MVVKIELVGMVTVIFSHAFFFLKRKVVNNCVNKKKGCKEDKRRAFSFLFLFRYFYRMKREKKKGKEKKLCK